MGETGFSGFFCGVLITGAIAGTLYDAHRWEEKRAEQIKEGNRESVITQIEDQRKISSVFFQDTNGDGTNELITIDSEGRKTTLYAGSSNQYFSAEKVREIKQNALEREMQNYTNSVAGGQTR